MSEVYLRYPNGQIIYCQGNQAVNDIKFFFLQRATEGFERVEYKRLIAPFKKQMPLSDLDGFRRVCADHNYVYIGPKFLIKYFSVAVSCQLE
jgi:hypothetical protein